jgi:arylsulfatase A-like enzyme
MQSNQSQRRSWVFLGAVLPTILASSFATRLAAAEAAPAPGDRPNVLFVFIDQLRRDMCSVYSDRFLQTPHIDRLAAGGMTFDDAVSTCPVCTPYRGMLMTGRYPTHSGILLNWTNVSPVQNPDCLANVFARAGYDTGFIGKWHLAAGKLERTSLLEPDDKQIRAYIRQNRECEFVPPGPDRLGFMHWEAYNFHGRFAKYFFYRDKPKRIFPGKYETTAEIDQAIAYMKKHRDSGRPFLLVVAPHPPHPPFEAAECPKGYLAKIPVEIDWPPNVPRDNPRKVFPMRCYMAMVKYTDDQIGRLLAFLDESGLAKNTIVVLTADHGEMHGSHGRINKMVPYTEALSIPLIVRWPGHVPAGVRTSVLYGPMDHLPTLCALAGLEAPSEADGKDVSGALLGKGRGPHDDLLIMNYSSHWDYFQSGTIWPEWRGVFTGRYTYVKWLAGEEMLFDNEADPYQMKDLADDPGHAAEMARFRKRLGELLAEADDEFLPGTAYADWFDDHRRLVQTALGPVKR